MPDILIRGMEMPQSCATCDLFGEYGCAFIGAVGYALTQGRRNEDCPLLELPPHGDLIDMDKIRYTELYGGVEVTTANWIDSLPVVVPAERREE